MNNYRQQAKTLTYLTTATTITEKSIQEIKQRLCNSKYDKIEESKQNKKKKKNK